MNSSSRDFPSIYNRNINLTMDLNSKSTGGGYNSDVHTISYFARATYSLMDRYITILSLCKSNCQWQQLIVAICSHSCKDCALVFSC